MTSPRSGLASHAFVVARSAAIRHSPVRVRLFDTPYVLFRTREGRVAALEDRCAHRGVPLSRGKLQRDAIICPYHGWGYAPDGVCVRMPGAPSEVPLGSVRIPRLTTAERDGLVWVSASPEIRLPQRVEMLDPENCRFRWQSSWKAPVIEVQENFLDALHTHSVHAGLVRHKNPRRPVRASLTVEGDGFHVDYLGQPEQSGLLFHLFESRRIRERAYFSRCAVTQLEFVYAAGWSAWITLYCTPEDAQTTHVFASLHLEGRGVPAWLVRVLLGPFLSRVAQQDRRILELQQCARTDFPTRAPITTSMDIVRPYVIGAWDGGIEALPQSRSVELYI